MEVSPVILAILTADKSLRHNRREGQYQPQDKQHEEGHFPPEHDSSSGKERPIFQPCDNFKAMHPLNHRFEPFVTLEISRRIGVRARPRNQQVAPTQLAKALGATAARTIKTPSNSNPNATSVPLFMTVLPKRSV
jgi:hypothetical protein